MAKKNWARKFLDTPEQIGKIHNPRIYAKTFNLKTPMTFCANEDCVYREMSQCPAGDAKKDCPNCSSLDYQRGCKFYVGRPFQAGVLSDSLSGQYKTVTVITGRGTGKSSIIDTQKVIMESTTEPYVRAYLYRMKRPVPAKILVVGNTKATSLLLRRSIHNTFESSEDLYSFVDTDTKTLITTNDGLCEIHFLTAGIDGRGLRGHHAEVLKNELSQEIKSTILFIFDEAMFTRATNVIGEVMRPSLQIGNSFSQIMVTSTPYSDKGEVSEIRRAPSSIQKDYSFASYHNKYTDLKLLADFRRKMIKAGQGAVFNREVLGREESDEGLYWPFIVWAMSIDDNLDWLEFEEIERLADTFPSLPLPGRYYCGVDPNKFRQVDGGDFASYHLVQATDDRSVIHAKSYGKYQMDVEGTFDRRMEIINAVFRPMFCVDENSGYQSKLRDKGYDVRSFSNQRTIMNRAMRIWKQDIIDGRYKQPSSQDWEDERACFIPKEDGVMNMPFLDHKGGWGSGNSSDLMRSGGYIYQAMMEDFGIEDIDAPFVIRTKQTIDGLIKPVQTNSVISSIVRSSRQRMGSIK